MCNHSVVRITLGDSKQLTEHTCDYCMNLSSSFCQEKVDGWLSVWQTANGAIGNLLTKTEAGGIIREKKNIFSLS